MAAQLVASRAVLSSTELVSSAIYSSHLVVIEFCNRLCDQVSFIAIVATRPSGLVRSVSESHVGVYIMMQSQEQRNATPRRH
jgi:ABC-type uncharacterized transport system ATPase subunit